MKISFCLFMLFLTLLFLASGCAQRKLPGVGPSNLLTIVTNLGPGDPAIEELRTAFTVPVISVEEEYRYAFEIHGPTGLPRQRDARNLVLVADLSRRDAVSRKVREVLGKERAAELLKRPGWEVLPNVEALGQTMVVIAGGDKPGVLELLKAESGNLYSRTDSMVTQRALDIVYMNGEDRAMERYLISQYGWTVRIPKGFRTAEDRKNSVVKLVGSDVQEPTRLFLAYWTPSRDSVPDPEYCLKLRARLVWLYYDRDRIQPGSSAVTETNFLGRKAIRIDGIWQNEKHIIGGPFFTICFVDRGRLYLLDGVAFAPGMDKSPWLRQLEAIMLTFRDLRNTGKSG